MLTEPLKTVNANMMSGPQAGVTLRSESWENNELKITEQQQELEKQVETFLDYIA